MPVIKNRSLPFGGIMPDHARDRGAVRLDLGASRSQVYQPRECVAVYEAPLPHAGSIRDFQAAAKKTCCETASARKQSYYEGLQDAISEFNGQACVTRRWFRRDGSRSFVNF